ncbi:hypothetical protein [Actinomadura sp. NPDC048394]|jgi:hypothetical protein|uniref:hypothetical protein n=1 Tax=Actinomadura sp. NPDC048394 TaxID=3158223 RepID=UPI0033ECD4EA
MKSTRPRRRGPRRARSVWGRVAGYGGAALLVAAAIVVLLVPLLDKHKDGAGAAGTTSPGASPTAGQGVVPGGSGQPVTPTNPVPQNSGGSPYTGGGQGGGQGGGMQIPDQNGAAGTDWCPQGTAFYRAAGGNIDVTITVSSSGAIRAELSIKGHAPQAQQTTVSGGKPHTFRFKNVPAQLVRRVKVTTVSVGVAMQNCYARPA